MTQVARLNDKKLHSAYIYYKYLNKFLPKENTKAIDVKDLVDLEFFKMEKKFEGNISLIKEYGELNPDSGDVGKVKEDKIDKLSEIIKKVNAKYKTNFTHMDKVYEQIQNDFFDDERMREFAKKNDEKGFKEVYEGEFMEKILNRYEANDKLFTILFQDNDLFDEIKLALFDTIYEKLKKK